MSSSERDVRMMVCGDKSALEKHVSRFVSPDSFFSPTTVADGLEKIHSRGPVIKGVLIASFNSSHAGNACPFLRAKFESDPIRGYAKYLHLGTTRIWNQDGTINQERWRQFVDFVLDTPIEGHVVVTKSKMKDYLDLCKTIDSEEPHTGRHARGLFSSQKAQVYAAISAWDEVYDRLTCGWLYNEALRDYEPYIHLDLIRLFFEDSEKAFLKAENGLLPVPKPSRYPGMGGVWAK